MFGLESSTWLKKHRRSSKALGRSIHEKGRTEAHTKMHWKHSKYIFVRHERMGLIGLEAGEGPCACEDCRGRVRTM